MTAPQRSALRAIERRGGEAPARVFDGRVVYSLEKKGLVARSTTDFERLVLTRDARDRLSEMAAIAEIPQDPSKDHPPSTRQLAENMVEAAEANVRVRTPDFADVEPEPDGMVSICCEALEGAIAAKVVIAEPRHGRIYLTTGKQHWLAHFCPFCGAARRIDGGTLDVEG